MRKALFIVLAIIIVVVLFVSGCKQEAPTTEKIERMKILKGYQVIIDADSSIQGKFARQKFKKIAFGLGASEAKGKSGKLFCSFDSPLDGYSGYSTARVSVETADGLKPLSSDNKDDGKGEISQPINTQYRQDRENDWYELRRHLAKKVWEARAELRPRKK